MTVLRNHLGAKILLVMAGVLIATSLIFLPLLMSVYRSELLAERQAVSSRLVSMLHITLENAMLKRDIDGLREIVERLGRSDNLAAVMIANPAGEVRFSSVPEFIGRRFQGVGEICPGCALNGQRAETASAFMVDDKGRDVLRSVNVVANREPCTLCHGPLDQNPVNGLLVVDYAAANLKDQATRTAVLLATAGFIVLLGSLAATWLVLRRLVIAPVARLSDASRALAEGDLSARAGLSRGNGAEGSREGDDEIADLARNFDQMATRLERTVGTLRAHEAFQQAWMDGIADGVRVIDDNFTVVAANAQYCRQVGRSLTDVVGRPCFVSSHGRSEACIPTLIVCPVVIMRKHPETLKCTHTHVDANGSNMAVEIIAAPIEMDLPEGPKRFIVESIRDLASQVQVSQEQRLSEIGLLATGLAHEIHNPLTSIRLGIKAIQRNVAAQSVDAEIKDYIGMVDSEIDRCLNVTERLMWLSQPAGEHGTLVGVEKVVRDVAALLHYEAESRKLRVVIEADPSARVLANGSELGMIVLNLVQNAFHASPAGGVITVRSRLTDAKDVEITVEDNGVGIAPENLEKIFYPFWTRRADGSMGSGLGLAICKELVKKWNGTIGARSAPGQGATFTLVFPSAERAVGLA